MSLNPQIPSNEQEIYLSIWFHFHYIQLYVRKDLPHTFCIVQIYYCLASRYFRMDLNRNLQIMGASLCLTSRYFCKSLNHAQGGDRYAQGLTSRYFCKSLNPQISFKRTGSISVHLVSFSLYSVVSPLNVREHNQCLTSRYFLLR